MFSREAPDEDDFFKDTRMSFGDHIEALRRHLWRAIGGLLVCCVIGFILDFIGLAVGVPQIGVGRPLFAIIEVPVKKAVETYNANQMKKFKAKLKESKPDDEIRATSTLTLKYFPWQLIKMTGGPLKLNAVKPMQLRVQDSDPAGPEAGPIWIDAE